MLPSTLLVFTTQLLLGPASLEIEFGAMADVVKLESLT